MVARPLANRENPLPPLAGCLVNEPRKTTEAHPLAIAEALTPRPKTCWMVLAQPREQQRRICWQDNGKPGNLLPDVT